MEVETAAAGELEALLKVSEVSEVSEVVNATGGLVLVSVPGDQGERAGNWRMKLMGQTRVLV